MCFVVSLYANAEQAAYREHRSTRTDGRPEHAQGARSLLLYDAVDEPVASLGQALKLPAQYEPRRKEIEAVLPAIAA